MRIVHSFIIGLAIIVASFVLQERLVNAQHVRVNGVTSGSGVSFPLTGASASGCTAGAIPYSFSGDSNTGVSTSAADVLGLCVSGFAALSVSATQATFNVAAVTIGGTTFAGLGVPGNGTLTYCTDCVVAATCAGSGSGALAKRINGAWVCN